LHSDQVILELTKKVDFLSGRLSAVEKENRELTKRIDLLEPLAEKNKDLRQENSALKTENAELKSKVAELEARLNSNSRNSSKPPSSDGYQKKPAFPRKKKGKEGGQQGHQGRTLRQVEHPDKTVKHKPGSCVCGHEFSDEELSVAEKRARFSIYPNLGWKLSPMSC
jgi:transposase